MLTLDARTGNITFRRDTKLKSAWQQQLEHQVEVDWNTTTTTTTAATHHNRFQISLDTEQPPPALSLRNGTTHRAKNVYHHGLQRQLKSAYRELDHA